MSTTARPLARISQHGWKLHERREHNQADPELQRQTCEGYQEYKARLDSMGYHIEEQDSEWKSYITFLGLPPSLVVSNIEVDVEDYLETQFLALQGSRCIGRVGVRHVGCRSAGVRQLYVEPEFRMYGLGRMLIEKCERVSRASGCESLVLTIARRNRTVEGFYERLGFLFACNYAEGEIVMMKSLSTTYQGKHD